MLLDQRLEPRLGPYTVRSYAAGGYADVLDPAGRVVLSVHVEGGETTRCSASQARVLSAELASLAVLVLERLAEVPGARA